LGVSEITVKIHHAMRKDAGEVAADLVRMAEMLGLHASDLKSRQTPRCPLNLSMSSRKVSESTL
jgi:hypothetical protein